MQAEGGDAPRVLVQRRGAVAVVTLSDPARRNAISGPLRDALVATVAELEGDDAVRALVVTGAGSAFCSGAVLASLETTDAAAFRTIYDAFLCLARTSLPTVAAVNGPAVGAGLNLALACDACLVGPGARLLSGFLRIGLHPGGGHTWLLQRAGGTQLAAAMALFGLELDAEAAVRHGLALRCVPAAALVDEAVALAAGAAAAPPPLAARLKATLRAMPAVGDHDAAVEAELEVQAWSAQQRAGWNA